MIKLKISCCLADFAGFVCMMFCIDCGVSNEPLWCIGLFFCTMLLALTHGFLAGVISGKAKK